MQERHTTDRPVPEPTDDPGAGEPTSSTRWVSAEPAVTDDDRGRPARRGVRFLTELPVLVLIAFVLALLLKTFLVQAFYIPSSSMEPTLDIGDRVLVNKIAYTFREPRRGEVVVFSEQSLVAPLQEDTGAIRGFLRSLAVGLGISRPSEKDFIKRIIGLPGETIEYREGVIYIDGEPLPEAPTSEGGYLSAPDLAPFGPMTIPEGQYFMMGDNRPSSADSRSLLGTIPREDIIGRAFVVIWPFGHVRTLPIADYDRAGGAEIGHVDPRSVPPARVAAAVASVA